MFGQYDVWFETDPNYFLAVFARGPFWFYIRHPALAELVHAPVALGAKVLAALGAGAEEPLRDSLALLAVPAIAAARTFVVLSMVRRLVGALYPTVLLGVIDIAAAASVTVCSVPESYAFTAASLAAAFWLALDDEPRPRWLVAASWLVVASLAIGFLLSNVVSIALLAWASLVRHGRGSFRSVTLVAALVGAALVADAAIVCAGAWSFHYRVVVPTGVFAEHFVHPPSATVLAGILWAIAHTFLAPAPGTEPLVTPADAHLRFDFMFSYAPPFAHGWSSVWRAAATVAILGLGTAGLLRASRLRPIVAAVIGIVLCNVAIHLYYGIHFNLYAGHWEPALLVLMAGTAVLPPPAARLGTIALSGFAVLTIASSAALLNDVLTYLATH